MAGLPATPIGAVCCKRLAVVRAVTCQLDRARRFSPTWSVDNPDHKLDREYFIVRGHNGLALAYVCCEEEPGRRRRRIAGDPPGPEGLQGPKGEVSLRAGDGAAMRFRASRFLEMPRYESAAAIVGAFWCRGRLLTKRTSAGSRPKRWSVQHCHWHRRRLGLPRLPHPV
jgi:hypothetical protein